MSRLQRCADAFAIAPHAEDIREQLAAAYDSCVRTSFASQLPTMVDRNMAIDQEKKFQDVSNAAISVHRNTLKEELLRR
jgi:hypothetical protein